MTNTPHILPFAASLTLALTCVALAQDPGAPPPSSASSPSNYIPAIPASPAKQAPVMDPDVPADAEPQWDGDKPVIPEMHAPQFPAPLMPPEMLDGFKPAAMAAFNLSNAHVLEPRTVTVNDTTFVALTIDGQDRVALLQPHNLREPGARLLVQREAGLLVDTPWPEPTTYRGVIEGMPGSQVAASIYQGKVSMLIAPEDKTQPALYLQPLSDGLGGMPATLHVMYRNTDVLPTNATCGVSEWDHVGQAPAAPGAAAAPPAAPAEPALARRVESGHDKSTSGGGDEGGLAGDGGTIAVANIRVQIAHDTDVEFYQANGSSVFNTIYDIERIMNQIGLIYQNQVAISYTETGIIVRTAEPDPYTQTNATALLCEFRAFWNTNGPLWRDVAHLWSAKNFDGTTVGLATTGGICNGTALLNGCSGVNHNDYGIVQSTFAPDLANRVSDHGHELGHNWNACHCNAPSCGGTSNPNNCGIMTSNISGSWTFDSTAVASIIAYRDSRPCLDVWQNPTHVNWANGGFENGSAANPWNTIFEGLDAALVGGEVHAQAGNYLQNPNIFKILTIRAFNGTVRIGN